MSDEPFVPPIGSLEELRAEAVENLHLVAFHADMAARQGEVTADAGMIYNTRRAAAHLKHVIGVLNMLHARKQREIARADERRADHGLNGAQRRGESA